MDSYRNRLNVVQAAWARFQGILWTKIPLVSGSNPLQLQGRPTCPRGQSARREGGIRDEIDPSPSRSEDLQDKAEPQAVGLTQPPRESREEPDQEARPRRKQNGGLPLVIDKTKGIQACVYLVYIVYQSVAVPRTDQRTDHPY